MQQILDAILAGDTSADAYASLALPESYRAVTVHKDEVDMFEGLATRDKDPRRSLHVDDVPLPELGPGEALVAVMASAINYNTVWTSIFEPMPTFGFLERYGRTSPLAKRHDLPYHIVGSDLSGVVLATGAGVHLWKAGDEVVAHCLSVELESPDGHNDTMLDPEQRIWGFETNFGGLAEIALVKSNQLMPKPAHLTWEEAASPGLVNSTAYRQLVSRNGAGMKQGDFVLIWGASGGLGGFATQYALNGGAVQAGECPAGKAAVNPLADAPSAPAGVKDVELSSIDLSKENVKLNQRRLRLRAMTIEAGGIAHWARTFRTRNVSMPIWVGSGYTRPRRVGQSLRRSSPARLLPARRRAPDKRRAGPTCVATRPVFSLGNDYSIRSLP